MFVVRIIDDTLEEGRGDIFGSGEVLSLRGVKGAVLPTAARIPRRISGFCQNILLVFLVN
jgi:hypothetical protein